MAIWFIVTENAKIGTLYLSSGISVFVYILGQSNLKCIFLLSFLIGFVYLEESKIKAKTIKHRNFQGITQRFEIPCHEDLIYWVLRSISHLN
jgi:hypothetical protein